MILRGKYNDIHNSAKIADDVIISGYCYIGKDVEIGSGTQLGNYCNLDTGAKIGKNCNLQAYDYVPSDTVIGDRCFFSDAVTIADEVFPSVGKQVRRKVAIGNNVIIGMKATIIASNIGNNSVIGSASLVLKDIPSDQVWVGSPARYLYGRSEYDRRKTLWEAKV